MQRKGVVCVDGKAPDFPTCKDLRTKALVNLCGWLYTSF